jgi:multidrug efflux system membrane fusion protein
VKIIPAALVAAALLTGCGRDQTPKAASAVPPPVPVEVAAVAQRDVAITLNAIGTVEARASVVIRPQVAGQVRVIDAREGTEVKAEDPLITLDERPFQAAFVQARAQLAKDIALAAEAQATAERYAAAGLSGGATENELTTARAAADAADAQVAADRAMVSIAELNLEYCRIAAPWAGRLGQILVRPGAIVEENKTDLVELTSIAPIDVSFSLPEQNLRAVQAAAAAGHVPVTAQTGVEPGAPSESGALSFIDNRVDRATGSIRLKATFDNADRLLWPGRFVTVGITIGQNRGALVVPDSAVQPSQKGSSVWVVRPDQTAEMRLVTVDRSADGVSIVSKGLAAGETVVTDGQLRLSPGAKVQVKPVPPTSGQTASTTSPEASAAPAGGSRGGSR